uniref:Uncharacterized protein n=1 Tax=Anguilla anguilla TaxID=7936 RepID=A0A0E9R090_ANGAN
MALERSCWWKVG